MSAWPQHDRWWTERITEIRQTSREFPGVTLALDEVKQPGPTGIKNQPLLLPQEANMIIEVESPAEVASLGPQKLEVHPKVLEEVLQERQCEYCGTPLKPAKQARAIHLRYCEPYKARKANESKADKPGKGTNGVNGHAPAFSDTSSAPLALTAEQTSKLWQAITGGHLTMVAENGQVTCWVSLDSFNKALPVLLERL